MKNTHLSIHLVTRAPISMRSTENIEANNALHRTFRTNAPRARQFKRQVAKHNGV